MKTYKYFFIFGLLLCCISCTQKSKYNDCSIFDKQTLNELQTITLTGERIAFEPEILNPVKLGLTDSILILANMNTEMLLDKYNTNTLRKIGSCIPFGSGPNEMLIATQMQRVDSSIWLLDQSQNKLYQFGLADFIARRTPTPIKTLKFDIPVNNAFVLPSGLIVATTLDPEKKRLSFFDNTGKWLRDAGEYPNFGRALTGYEKIESFIPQMALSEDKRFIILTHKRTDLIEIYDIQGNLIIRTQGPDLFYPAMRQQKDGEYIRVTSEKGKERDAYFNPQVCGNELFVLYSGDAFDGQKANYLMDLIIVFDLSGNPIRQYKLSEPIFNFTIDPKAKCIYGISDNPEFHIAKFEY